MKVGFGKAVITPPVGFSLVGYFHDRRSIGIKDDLYSISAVFDDGKEIFVVITCDLVWIDKKTVNKVRELVFEDLKIPHKNILIHATHTHTGPLISLPESSIYTKEFYVGKSYIETLPFYIAGSVRIAWENREDVKIGFGKDTVEGIAFNRRYLLKDGRIVTNPFLQKDKIVKSAGPVDKTVGVLKVENKKGQLKGLFINFALHPDTLGETLISADWPGLTRNKLMKKFPDMEVMVLNGPSGDINHLNPSDTETRSLSIGEKISTKLKKAVLKLLPEIKTKNSIHLKSFGKEIKLPYSEISTAEYKKAVSDLKKKLPHDSLQFLISQQIVNLEKEKKKEKEIRTEINGFSIGKDFLLLGLPGEIFTEIGMNIKKNTPFKNVFIAQNSNDHIGYIPSQKAFLQHKKNLVLKPAYGSMRLTEAIGINCSYETTPLACKVGEEAGEILQKESVKWS